MAAALRSVHQTPSLLTQCGKMSRPSLVLVPARGMRVKEFKTENPMNPQKPWPYETKPYKWYHSVLNLDRTVNRMDENSKVILIEGNIGAGKSTLAKNLAEMLGMRYYPEADISDYYDRHLGIDLRKFKDRLGPTAQHFDISQFYEDPHHPLVARFQVCKYVARYYQYCEALLHLFSTGQGVIMERSAYSDFVFADALMKQGFMGRPARRYYYELKSNTIQDLMRPHCIIYLDTPVDVCLQRIKMRNIPYEVKSEALTGDYLKLLESGYKEKFLPQMEPFCQTIVYDWSKFADAEVVAEDLEKLPFDVHRYYYDPMFRDWSDFYIKSDWDEPRVKYTKWEEWACDHASIPEFYGANEMWMTPDDSANIEEILNEENEKKSQVFVGPNDGFLVKLKSLLGIPTKKPIQKNVEVSTTV